MPKADGAVIIDTKINDENLNELHKDFQKLNKILKDLVVVIKGFTSAIIAASKDTEQMDKASKEAADSADNLARAIKTDAAESESFAREAGAAEDKTEKLGKELEDAAKNADDLADGLDKSGERVESAAENMDRLTDKSEDAAEELKDAENASKDLTRELGDVGDASSAASRDLNKVSNKADNAADEFSDAARAADKLVRELDDVGDNAEEASRDLDKVADKAGKVQIRTEKAGAGLSGESISAAASAAASASTAASMAADVAMDLLQEAAEALKDFVLDSISAAAEVKAANAQFAQTFKDLEKTAERSLQKISDQTKISVSRMKGSYASIYAFTKSVGADSVTAMDIANRAMVAAADSAAYYDRTIEDATETLQSFLKGNYENDAALGIAATETTRNAKANEKYAKSFDKLSESQKVDVLLAMVEAGNEASGALGQAAREADSWANVTGEATEAVKKLMAAMGDPVLEAIIPKIQEITKWINKLVDGRPSKKHRENMEDIADSWEKVEVQFKETAEEIELTAGKADYYIQRLKELEAAGLDTAESQTEYARVVARLNELYPTLNLEIDENTGRLKMNTEEIDRNVEAMKKKALYEAYEQRYSAILKAQAEAHTAMTDATHELNNITDERKVLQEQVTAATGKDIDTLKKQYNALKTVQTGNIGVALALSGSTGVIGGLLGAIGLLSKGTKEQTDSTMELVGQIIALEDEEKRLWTGINESAIAISDYDEELKQAIKDMDDASKAMMNFSAGQGETATSTETATEAIRDLEQAHLDAKAAARESIDAQIGLFDELTVKSDKSAAQIVENWKKQKEAFLNYADNLQKAIDMGLDEELVRQLSDGSAASMAILDEFVNGTSANIDQINDAFKNLNQAKDTAADAIAGVQTDVDGELKEIIKDAHMAGADIPEVLAKGISEHSGYVADAMRELAQDALKVYYDSLKGMNFPIPQKSSGKYDVVPYADTASVAPSAFSVPYLATGAVIPPNAPFMAVLGDQRRGTNVEAPLSTIQEAVALVMQDQAAAMLAGFEALLQENRMLRQTVEGIEVGDTTIGQAADRYARKMAVVRGGG